jgi:hypothetical protein
MRGTIHSLFTVQCVYSSCMRRKLLQLQAACYQPARRRRRYLKLVNCFDVGYQPLARAKRLRAE